MSWQDREKEELKADEGLRLKVYKDTLGNATIGYGHLDREGLKEVSLQEAEDLFEADFEDAVTAAAQAVPFFAALDGARKGALVNMAFNLGETKLAEFHGMLNALDEGDWSTAALHLMNSRYARQVGNRAKRLAYRFRTGEYSLR